jgi:hypothetical protein
MALIDIMSYSSLTNPAPPDPAIDELCALINIKLNTGFPSKRIDINRNPILLHRDALFPPANPDPEEREWNSFSFKCMVSVHNAIALPHKDEHEHLHSSEARKAHRRFSNGHRSTPIPRLRTLLRAWVAGEHEARRSKRDVLAANPSGGIQKRRAEGRLSATRPVKTEDESSPGVAVGRTGSSLGVPKRAVDQDNDVMELLKRMKKVSLRAKPSVSAQRQASVVQQLPPAPQQPPQQTQPSQQQQTPKQRQQPMRKAKQQLQPATSAARVARATHREILAPVRDAGNRVTRRETRSRTRGRLNVDYEVEMVEELEQVRLSEQLQQQQQRLESPRPRRKRSRSSEPDDTAADATNDSGNRVIKRARFQGAALKKGDGDN